MTRILRRLRIGILVLCVFTNLNKGYAQSEINQDSVRTIEPKTNVLKRTVISDSIGSSFIYVDTTAKKPWPPHKKALLWALVLPGAGQVYNRKFWKLPILFAGVGAVVYFYTTNRAGFAEFKGMYNTVFENQQANPGYTFIYGSERTLSVYTSINQLSAERDGYRRNRDFAIAGAVALYAISILDAYVDAHLRSFDLSPDLSLRLKPILYASSPMHPLPGLSLGISFKSGLKKSNE